MARLTSIWAVGLVCLVGVGAALQAQDKTAVPPPASVVVQVEPAQPDAKLSDTDRAKAEQELRDLESQRSKLDSRIRDLRRKLGRYEWSFVLPNVNVLRGEGWTGREMTPEQREQLRKSMQKAREDMRRAGEEMRRALRENWRSIPDLPRFESPVPPRVPDLRSVPQADPGVRAEIDELRREIQKLRDEMRSRRGGADKTSGPV